MGAYTPQRIIKKSHIYPNDRVTENKNENPQQMTCVYSIPLNTLLNISSNIASTNILHCIMIKLK